MFESQSKRGNYPNAKKGYDSYKTRIYQTERIINLIKEGWKFKKNSER